MDPQLFFAKSFSDCLLTQASVTIPIQAPTTSLDPYDLDDDLIPCQAVICNVTSCFLKTPDCYGGHGKSYCLCTKTEFVCCKPGREEEEIVVWFVYLATYVCMIPGSDDDC